MAVVVWGSDLARFSPWRRQLGGAMKAVMTERVDVSVGRIATGLMKAKQTSATFCWQSDRERWPESTRHYKERSGSEPQWIHLILIAHAIRPPSSEAGETHSY